MGSLTPRLRRAIAPTPEGQRLYDDLAAWAAVAADKVTGAWPFIPDGVQDRDADVWEALLAVADAAGDPWPDRARVAAVTLVTASKAATPSLGVRLLSDLRTVFEDRELMFTSDVVEALAKLDEAPWGDLRGKALDARGLSNRLSNYDVKPTTIRIEEKVAKGYKRTDLHDPWNRYLQHMGPPAIGAVTSVTSGTDVVDTDDYERRHPEMF